MFVRSAPSGVLISDRITGVLGINSMDYLVNPCSYTMKNEHLANSDSALTESLDWCALSYADRLNAASMFASVIDPKEKRARGRIPAFRKLMDSLNFDPEDQLRMWKMAARGRRDPLQFALALKEQNARHKALWGLLSFVVASGCYDSRDRECIRMLALAINVPWDHVLRTETVLARHITSLEEFSSAPIQGMHHRSKGRAWKIALASVIGGTALVASGGLGGLLIEGAIGVGLTTSLLGATGAAVAGRKVANRTREVRELGFEYLGGEGMHVCVAISGWLTEEGDFSQDWAVLPKVAGGYGVHYALHWESQHLRKLGRNFLSLGGKLGSTKAASFWAERAGIATARALAWPITLLMGADLIDNAWHMGADRAKKAGILLAETLRANHFGYRPVTLIGFSLGARLLFYALEDLARTGDKGIIHHAILIGGAVTADPDRWNRVHTVVSGKLINGYCRTDYVLSYLYRIAALQPQVAGLGPIDSSRVENVDVTDLSTGHLKYKKALELILRRMWRRLDCP